MEQEKRLEAFEAMLWDVRRQYEDRVRRMQALREQGRERSATYRQLMGQKLQLSQMLSLYRLYGLLEP